MRRVGCCFAKRRISSVIFNHTDIDLNIQRMKILLLGSNGQVGKELARALLSLGTVVPWTRVDADFTDVTSLSMKLASMQFDVIVNASAYTDVDRAETDVETVFAVNARAVACLAEYAAMRNALLVHYSTNYVFDGKKESPYLPDDDCAPLGVYGQSKLEGECAILSSHCKTLILRTSWVFSVHHKNFIKTILSLAVERDQLHVVDDEWGVPTSAEFIADITSHAILACLQGRLTMGIHHLTSSGRTSRYELARYVLTRALYHGKSLRVTLDDIQAISSSDYPCSFMRPKNACLSHQSLSEALGMQFPEWPVYVNRVIEQLCQQGR